MCNTASPVKSDELAHLFHRYKVPRFPDFRHLKKNDKDLIEIMLATYEPVISELNFTNLYGWNLFRKFSISTFENSLILQSSPLNGEGYLIPPVGEADHSLFCRNVQSHSGQVPQTIRFIDESIKPLYKDYQLIELRDYWDYVYSTEDLAYLKGRKYSKKRNLIHQFEREVEDYTLHPITPQNIEDVIAFLEKWCRLRQCCGKEYQCQEFKVTRKCLEEWKDLSCQGGYITINNSIEAFIVAEQLNSDTAVIHFEKANPDIHGLYQVINRDYTARYLQDYQWINREQDIGLPGLRQAKESYHPSHFIKKYEIRL